MNSKIEMFCVFYVDMESSTYNTAWLPPDDYTFYYRVFYETLTEIAGKFGGKVLKHVGDALIIYFPATAIATNRMAFKSTLDCAMAMLGARCTINDAYHSENLPPLSFRISADYGRLEYVETGASSPDWIGPSMNMVAKMNHIASTNSMVVGGDLHHMLSRFSLDEYLLEIAGELNIGIRQKYPIYSVAMRKNNGSIGIGIFSPGSMALNAAPSIVRLNKDGRAGALPNVVIVDDEQDTLQIYQGYLSGQAMNVELFTDPIQLLGRLALVGPSYYDLAILDIRMPKMNGFQVYQILAGLKPSIKALFVTALDYAEEFLTTLRWIDKEHDIMRKPVTRQNFISAVNKKINICAPVELKTLQPVDAASTQGI